MGRWRRIRPTESFESYFWEQVDIGPSGRCWPWTRSLRNGIHGSISRSGEKQWAHRIAYELTYGPIPDGMVVRHSCDYGRCCNPAHLVIGTQSENMADALARGRTARGEKNGNAKLTAADVRQIRAELANGASRRQLADHFGVSIGAVKHIALGTTWPEPDTTGGVVMTAAKYLQTGDWVTHPASGSIMVVTAPPEPLGQRSLLLTVWTVGSGDQARYTVDQDEDYTVLGSDELRSRRIAEQGVQLALGRELLASQRIVAAIDTHLAVTP